MAGLFAAAGRARGKIRPRGMFWRPTSPWSSLSSSFILNHIISYFLCSSSQFWVRYRPGSARASATTIGGGATRSASSTTRSARPTASPFSQRSLISTAILECDLLRGRSLLQLRRPKRQPPLCLHLPPPPPLPPWGTTVSMTFDVLIVMI